MQITKKFQVNKNSIFFFLILLLLYLSFHTQGKGIETRVIESKDDLPSQVCRIWKKGDLLISDGKYLAIVGGTSRQLKTTLTRREVNAMGTIISFAPVRENLVSDLGVGAPVLKFGEKRKYPVYSSIKQFAKSSISPFFLEARAFYEENSKKIAEIITRYNFFPREGRIDITSTLSNIGNKKLKNLDYSLYFNAFHRYSFNPYNKKFHPGLNFRIFQKKGYYLAWINMSPRPDDPFPGNLSPGETFTVRHVLLSSIQRTELLEKVYRILSIKPIQTEFLFNGFKGKYMEVIIKNVLSGSIFFRTFLKQANSLNIPLPQGIYEITCNFFPAVIKKYLEVRPGNKNSCFFENPTMGTLRLKILDSDGKYVPGKVTFIGLESTSTPYFEPENPVTSERQWETYKNTVFPPEEGLTVKVPLGRYLVCCSRGPEYSLDQKIIEVSKQRPLDLVFRINRIIQTPNLVSIDTHMHTLNSPDGTLSISERIKSVVAEGVDVAVATDHNFITSYKQALQKLGLGKYLYVISGNETTHTEVIHYISFPLKKRPEQENNGAINPVSRNVSSLFNASRKKDPGILIQVNHPRRGTRGYFNNYLLDKESASSVLKTFDFTFDLVEIMNGYDLST